jgi:hypothetical protein
MSVSRWMKEAAPLGVASLVLAAAVGCSGDRDAAPAEPETDEAQAVVDEGEAAGAEPEDGTDEPEVEEVETARPGARAPSFTLPGSDGEEYSLEDYRGQWVILEWVNHGCPYVTKFYSSGKMQELQAELTDPEGAGVAWFSVASSGPGQQGYETAEGWNELNEEKGTQATAVLLDPEGTVGQQYEARTTPHMYIIDPEGTLVYHGAIDSNSSSDPADLADAENYVEVVMSAVLAGEAPPYEYRDPYGCSVKYGPKS